MPNSAKEQRVPDFANGTRDPNVNIGVNKFLWGQEPALELIRLDMNESVSDLARNLHILCAASGDPRHIIKSIASLPEEYGGKCTVVTNDADFEIVARSIIFFLIAGFMPDEEAAPTIIHLWSSAMIPSSMLHRLQIKVLPLIRDVCSEISQKASTTTLAKTFRLDSGSSVRIVLMKTQWFKLQDYFIVPATVTREAAKSVSKFREDGILLPFGTSRAGFDTPNPEVASASKRMAYPTGALFYVIRAYLVLFTRKLNKGIIHIELFCVETRDLAATLKSCDQILEYGRIEISHLSERCFWGPATAINTFTPFLKRRSTIPHATLLLYFPGACKKSKMRLTSTERHAELDRARARTEASYLSFPNPRQKPIWHPDYYHFQGIIETAMFDWDKMWAIFEADVDMLGLVKKAGLRMKKPEEQSIAPAWPKRMKEENHAEFFNTVTRYQTCYECYVELVRAE
ncbi:hypothetical protein NX059_010732 [Plenodomus lindquistii]|nr:hypothetical protein NX059_010732 [Plenodomus lindquistii]